MHTVANQNIISQGLKVSCLAITIIASNRAMSPPPHHAHVPHCLAGLASVGALSLRPGGSWSPLGIIRIDLLAVRALINT